MSLPFLTHFFNRPNHLHLSYFTVQGLLVFVTLTIKCFIVPVLTLFLLHSFLLYMAPLVTSAFILHFLIRVLGVLRVFSVSPFCVILLVLCIFCSLRFSVCKNISTTIFELSPVFFCFANVCFQFIWTAIIDAAMLWRRQ